MKNNIQISLIVPCYNEEANIQKGVLDKIGNFTKDDKRFAEVLIVDDGSVDGSKKIIVEKYLSLFQKFKLIENQHQGKAYAIITGIQKAASPFVMFSDMDLATPIEESEKLIHELKHNYTIVIGSRNSRREGAPLSRQILSKGSILIKNLLVGLNGIKDTQCGFKLFKRESALKVLHHLKVFHPAHTANGPSVSAGFDLEFLFIATKLGYSIKEVPVIWRHVETKRVNFINDAIDSLKDILKIKYYYLKGVYEF